MKNYLIGIDLDGTLLTPTKTITQTTYDVLNEAIKRGNLIVPVTGRPLSGLPKELIANVDIRFAILNNGAVTVDLVDNSIVSKNQISKDSVIEIYNAVSSLDVIFEIFTDGYGYGDNESMRKLIKRYEHTYILDYILKSRVVVPDIYEHLQKNISNVDCISIMCNNPNKCADIRKMFEKIEDISIVSLNDVDLEINSINAGKGNALIALGSKLGISRERIIAIGDSDNDIQMLKMSGISIAMGNASEKVKMVSSYITEDNSHDGVAAAIKKIVL